MKYFKSCVSFCITVTKAVHTEFHYYTTIYHTCENLIQKLVSFNFACWVNFHPFDVICRFLKKITFSKNSFKNTIRVSNGLDPDQDRHSVGPDLGPN